MIRCLTHKGLFASDPESPERSFRRAKIDILCHLADRGGIPHSRFGTDAGERFEASADEHQWGGLARFLVEADLNHSIQGLEFSVNTAEERRFLEGLRLRALNVVDQLD